MTLKENLIVILGDQLFPIADLKKRVPPPAHIFMAESWDLCTAVRHHKQKILLFLAAMRHYRDELIEAGYVVSYHELTGPDDRSSFVQKLVTEVRKKKNLGKIQMYRVADGFFSETLEAFAKDAPFELQIWDSPGFLTTPELFGRYLENVRQPKMQSFYQQQRQRLDILMEPDGTPVGGKWSFDTENRKKLPKDLTPPPLPQLPQSAYAQTLMPQVAEWFKDHPGQVESFAWPVTRQEALHCLERFLEERLELFGPYEDAMSLASDFVYHSTLSPVLNNGLITPQEVVDETLSFARKKRIPIQSVEGFLRQIIGWREFVYGIYTHHGKRERASNFFGHERRLTAAWYDGTTGILPLDHCIKKAQRLGYVHHIERLMILSNIMLLAEIHPDDVYGWFMELFVDSAEWVMIPNVYGMGQFADGGLFATKPYIGGSNYILKMSDLPKGPWCDILDGLYWRFIERHRTFFLSNPRMSMMAHMLDKIPPARYKDIKAKAEDFLARTTTW